MQLWFNLCSWILTPLSAVLRDSTMVRVNNSIDHTEKKQTGKLEIQPRPLCIPLHAVETECLDRPCRHVLQPRVSSHYLQMLPTTPTQEVPVDLVLTHLASQPQSAPSPPTISLGLLSVLKPHRDRTRGSHVAVVP